MNDNMPESPLTSVEEGAVATHEMYCAMVRAGFSEDQALTLVSNILTATTISKIRNGEE